MGQNMVLGIDIGGSKIAAGLVDEKGGISHYLKWDLPGSYDKEYIIDTILGNINGIPGNDFSIKAAGVSIPGVTDAKDGIWVYAPFSGISDFPIAETLSGKLNIPVYIENDVNACAIGEKRYGCCKDSADFLWITVSNGIGGGLFLNNGIYRGASGYAGEIGHVKVKDNSGRVCGCGKTGCLEAEASGFAISSKYNEKHKANLTTKELAAMQENTEAAAAFYEAGFYIGKGITHAVNLLNIEKVVLGGGVSESFGLILSGIRAAVDKCLFSQANMNLIIEKTALGYHAGLLGAAAVGWNGIYEQREHENG